MRSPWFQRFANFECSVWSESFPPRGPPWSQCSKALFLRAGPKPLIRQWGWRVCTYTESWGFRNYVNMVWTCLNTFQKNVTPLKIHVLLHHTHCGLADFSSASATPGVFASAWANLVWCRLYDLSASEESVQSLYKSETQRSFCVFKGTVPLDKALSSFSIFIFAVQSFSMMVAVFKGALHKE